MIALCPKHNNGGITANKTTVVISNKNLISCMKDSTSVYNTSSSADVNADTGQTLLRIIRRQFTHRETTWAVIQSPVSVYFTQQ